uniref:CCR4-NOT transcription complex subunit 4 n=1 Tax=Anthurium amnicola TaxID=1678845 RepID=A0A1D1XGE8_9ARAE
MATMSDDGERTCPLCAEEMDLTDQQLKPCKCGYEICVWCWHHIIDMAEKDDTEGRCPACRTPYDKERIVGTAANCERMLSEVNAEKKQKSQKTKPKTSVEARKHLNSVRVIQRNLVYIIGLPSNLADETLLERREYFGQYGRVLKVSISRPAGGAQQTSNSNTFSVYITYAKEEEAVRCIQAVHNFVLDGKPLRACFGTTKYCRAWLRNMACNNPDCLYLHDIGSQEDSFTKDEIISAYTRSRVPPITLSNMHRRTGGVLPPPADDFSNTIPAPACNIAIKGASNAKSSPPDIGGSGRSAALPAAASWGLRANSRPLSSATSSLQCAAKPKPEVLNNSSVPSTGAHLSAWHDDVIVSASKIVEESRTVNLDGRSRPLESFRSAGRDSKMGPSISSADAAHVRESSAWYDDDITPFKTLKDTAATRMDGGSGLVESSKHAGKDSCTVLSNSSTEISATNQRSAWYDDELTTSNMPEKCHAVQFSSQSRPSDTSTSLVGKDSQSISSSLVDIAHMKEMSSWDDDVVATSMASEGNHAVSSKLSPAEASESCCSGEPRKLMTDFSAEVAVNTPHTSVTSMGQSSSLVAQEEADRKNLVASNANPVSNVCSEELEQISHGVVADTADISCTAINGNIHNLASCLSILNVDKHSGSSLPNVDIHSSVSDSLGEFRSTSSEFHQFYTDHVTGSLSLKASDGDTVKSQGAIVSRGPPDWALEPQKQVSDAEFRCGPSDVVTRSKFLPYSPVSFVHSDASSNHTDSRGALALVDDDSRASTAKINETAHLSRGGKLLSNGHVSNFSCSEEVGENLDRPGLVSVGDKMQLLGRLNDLSNATQTVGVDVGESNIIANILSMDFDPWDDSLASANNFAKFLGETDEQNGSHKMTNLWKGQSNRQSRFSFARQEGQTSFSKPSFSEFAHAQTHSSVLQDSLVDSLQNGFTASSSEDPMALNISGHSITSTDRSAVVSRAKTSAPPGFSVPNRLHAPPPGFSSLERFDQAYDTTNSESLMLGGSSLRSEYQMPASGNNGDVEFIDPAILAVGKGRLPHGVDNSGFDLRYTFPTQFNSSEIDPRLQLLMQQSVSAHQDLRIADNYGSRFLPLNDSYIPSRHAQQNLPSLPPFSMMSIQQQSRNSQWEGWNDVQTSSESGLSEMLRNKRLGLNRYFPGNEEKFPTGDIYNRGFGI